MPLDSTPRSAYSHWNEDQDMMWWDEVGRHAHQQMEEPPDPDPDEYREDPTCALCEANEEDHEH